MVGSGTEWFDTRIEPRRRSITGIPGWQTDESYDREAKQMYDRAVELKRQKEITRKAQEEVDRIYGSQ